MGQHLCVDVPVEVVAFLDDRAPGRRVLLDEWQAVLAGLSVPAAVEAVDLNRSLGVVFEKLVGLDLAVVPPYDGLFDFLDAADRQALLQGLGYRQTAGSHDSWRRHSVCRIPIDDGQRAAVERCARMQTFVELHRRYPHSRSERQTFGALWREATAADGERLAPWLLALWETYLRYGQQPLRALGNLMAVNEMLLPGVGEVDFIVGSTVIDVKVTSNPAAALLHGLDQLLFYVLLDVDYRHQLDRIGIYEGWRGRVLTSPIHTALGLDDPDGVAAVRRDFHTELRDLVVGRRRWYEEQIGAVRGNASATKRTE